MQKPKTCFINILYFKIFLYVTYTFNCITSQYANLVMLTQSLTNL